jgi:5-methylthioadenosine/S-adenosylhomocysteine deaminase
MSGERTLIRGATVITMEPGAADGPADILIEDDEILAIERELVVGDGSARVVDASDHIAIPGFIDTHRHLYQILMRGLGSNWSLTQYLSTIIGSLGPSFTPEDLYVANRLGALDAIDSGVTAVFDWCQQSTSREHTDALLAALESVTIRATFGSGADIIDLQECLSPPFISSRPTDADAVRRLRERYPSDTGLLTIGLAGRGPDHTTLQVVTDDQALARELGIRLNMHHGAGVLPGGSSIKAMGEAGLLGDNLTIGHANHFSDDDVRLMADHGVTVSVTPEDECNMGHGWPPINQMIAGGLWPNIGADTNLAVGSDFFTAMRFALAVPRAQHNAAELAAGRNPWTLNLTARDVLRMATVEGARALGQESRIGSLAVGKQADIVLIDTRHVSMMPVHDPVAAVVHHASRAVVSDVFVAGRQVKQHGQLVGVDTRKLHGEATEAAVGLVERAGVAPGWAPPPPGDAVHLMEA